MFGINANHFLNKVDMFTELAKRFSHKHPLLICDKCNSKNIKMKVVLPALNASIANGRRLPYIAMRCLEPTCGRRYNVHAEMPDGITC